MSAPTGLPNAATALAELVSVVDDQQLGYPTPCERWTVRELLAHIDGLSVAFRAAADKEFGPLTDTAPTDHELVLEPRWRERIPGQFGALVEAIGRPEAGEGFTRVGAVDLPAQAMMFVLADELVVHGWDLAVATGQHPRADADAVQVALGFAEQVGDDPTAREGLFGPRLPDTGTGALDRLLAVAGRDARWQRPGT